MIAPLAVAPGDGPARRASGRWASSVGRGLGDCRTSPRRHLLRIRSSRSTRRLSNSWIMRAVAPQIISPEISKKRIGEGAVVAARDRASGNAPALLVEDLEVGQLGKRDVEDPLDFRRVRHQCGPGRARWPSTGRMSEEETIGDHGMDPAHGRDRRRVEADLLVGLAERRRGGVLPSSSRPPGKLTSPGASAGQRRAGQDHAGLTRLLEERRQDAGVDAERPGAAALLTGTLGPRSGPEPTSSGADPAAPVRRGHRAPRDGDAAALLSRYRAQGAGSPGCQVAGAGSPGAGPVRASTSR